MNSPAADQGSPSFVQPLSIRIFPNSKSHRKLINSFDKDDLHPVRRYRKWKGKNVFLCGGHVMLGVHWSHLLCTVALIIFSWAQYTMLIVPFLHHHVLYMVALVLLSINLTLLFLVACTDPGILPRQHFRNEKSASTNIIRKDAAALRTNFCRICNIWRPSRARHCKYCDNCVDIFDHHCPWTGTCIGMRNYPQFFAFVSSVLVSALFILGCAVYLLLGWVLAGATTDIPVLRIIALGTTIPWCCIMLFMVGTLLAFHVYLIYRGKTTNEYFREKRAQRRVAPTPPVPIESTNTAASWCCWAVPWSNTAINNRQVTTSDDVYNSINSAPEVEDPQAPTSPADSHDRAPSLQLSMNDLNCPTQTKDSMLYTASQDLLRATTDLMLTPLFDAEATPFPHLSPSPLSPQYSPGSPQYSDAASHSPGNTKNQLLTGEGAVDNSTPDNAAVCEVSAPVPEHHGFQRLQIEGRSGTYNYRPQLSLTLPAIEEVKSESDRGTVSIQPSQDTATLDSAAGNSGKARSSCTCVVCAVLCLPCYAAARAGKQCGYLQTSQSVTTQEQQANAQERQSGRYTYGSPLQHIGSPTTTSTLSGRYTYAYLCRCVPIVPHSRLLPLWQYEDQRDAEQQEQMLEVLFDQLRGALRREALDSADYRV